MVGSGARILLTSWLLDFSLLDIFLALSLSSSSSSPVLLMAAEMASTMGTIMAVQAVFEIHMDRNMEQAMKPSMIRFGLGREAGRHTE